MINIRINVVTIPQITINRWYKPFPNGWFMIVLSTLQVMKCDQFVDVVGDPADF